MAEAAGLVIGGVGIIALFDSCMLALETIDTGRSYGRDYERAALRISLLRLKLSRWGASVTIVDDASLLQAETKEKLTFASKDGVATAKSLLGNIGSDLEDAERASRRHVVAKTASKDADTSDNTLQGLIQSTRRLAIGRQKSTGFVQKTRWALRDKRKLDRLIEDLSREITDLVDLFPTTKSKQQDLAKDELIQIVQPSEIEKPADVLKEFEVATKEVDPFLEEAINLSTLVEHRHTYEGITSTDNARIQCGDSIPAGVHVTGYGHTYKDIVASENSRIMAGDQYGGKSVFDD